MASDISQHVPNEPVFLDAVLHPLDKLKRRRLLHGKAATLARRTTSEPARAAQAAPPEPALAATPPCAPLQAPMQDLNAAGAEVRRGIRECRASHVARVLLVTATAGFGLLDAAVLLGVLGADGRITALEAAVIVLSVVLAAWLAFGVGSAVGGFALALGERAPARSARRGPPQSRTAILLPTYNEDPGLILAGLQAMAEGLQAVGLTKACDLFVLSDTRDPAIARAEAGGVMRLRGRLKGAPEIYYRRRLHNTDRKAGNITDWVETWGGAYDFMLVLDADSLMSGETIAELIARMEAEPGLGLLQTAPGIINAVTPFARIQQFANRLYGPVFARGQQWWSGSEGNYWGHNAIIRTRAFAESARLPHLSGPRPFGGHIQSHDFVEAALLRRAGWAVRMAVDLQGSHEESPPTLLDAAARDRRWCQGNLQHARILPAAGLHWVSRLHLLCGILAYVTPVLWLALVIVGGLVWPAQQMARGSAAWTATTCLFGLFLALLAAPKLMGLALALRDPVVRRGFGGRRRLVAGVVVESFASMLTTPVTMLMQSVAVFDVLLGRDSGWSAQHREGVELSGRDAWRAHWAHVLLGVAGAIGALLVSKDVLIWTSPVFLSLTLSALLSLHGSRPLPERAAGEARLLQTPEDATPPPVVARAMALRKAFAAEEAARRQAEARQRGPFAPVDGFAVPPAEVMALVA